MSLHLYLALTMTLLYCLAANPVPYKHIEYLIQEVRSAKCSEPASRFYSPSGSECNIQALGCAIQELDTVREECFEMDTLNKRHINRTKDSLELFLTRKNIAENDLKDVNNCFCGGIIRKTEYTKFLENILTQLQMFNSRQP